MDLKFSVINVSLLELHFKLNPDLKFNNDQEIEIKSQISIDFKRNRNMVNVIVSVNSDDSSQPFIFNIAVIGIFKFNKIPTGKEALNKLVYINCASIIFPYIRETIADLTRRSGMSPFHMDPINFVNLYQQRMQLLSSSTKKTTKPKTKK